MPITCPNEHFTIVGPQNPSLDEFYVAQNVDFDLINRKTFGRVAVMTVHALTWTGLIVAGDIPFRFTLAVSAPVGRLRVGASPTTLPRSPAASLAAEAEGRPLRPHPVNL